MLFTWLKNHWFGLGILILCFIALQFTPDWLMKAFIVLFFLMIIGISLFEGFLEKRLRRRVAQHIKELGYEVSEIKKWSEHFSVRFFAEGKSYYLKFEHGPLFGKVICWIDGKPEDVVKAPRVNK